MKKNYNAIKQILLAIFTVVIVMGMSFSGYGQNLVANGDFENWTVNGVVGPPDSWELSSSSSFSAEQETSNIHGGIYSTKLTWTTTSNRDLTQLISVTEENDYEFSFWTLDNEPAGRVRIAINWYDIDNSFISNFYGDYSSDSPDWQQISSGIKTSPVGAAFAKIVIRAYDVSSGWSGSATVYIDDATFEGAGSATPEISKAYSISNTAVDLEYNVDVTSVNASDYSLTGTSNITFTTATIDAGNAKIVHLSGASENMSGDITLDNIADAANPSNIDFYAGIMPVSFTNNTNPGGTMDNIHLATFSGIVSANDAYNNVWFSDASGAYNGILIYDYDFDGSVSLGDEILITANRDEYSNLTELKNPVLLSIISSGNTPFGPDVINASDIEENIVADTDPAEKWEGQLVKIENFTVESLTDNNYRCSWSDAKTTYYFIIGDNVDYHLNNISLNIGETYGSVTGVVDYSGKYRINPREQADITSEVLSANFTVDNNILILGQTASFTDLSSADPTSWSWTFEGGTPETSIEQNPANISYTLAGKYDVSLIVTNADDADTLTKTEYITVIDTILPKLVITEIMYNPPEGGNDSLEYVEIYNNDIDSVNLEGYYFSQGFTYVFPDITIYSGDYLLLGIDSLAMSNTFGVNVYQWTSGSLSNGGEDIILNDKYDRIIDSVNYDDYNPWTREPDGHGPSLTLCNPDFDNSMAENWWAAIEFAAVNAENDSIWGTPGTICSILADFVNSDTIVPMGANVQFTDLSYGNISSWTWTFSGGTPETSTEQNPIITYSTPGVYNVSLSVSGESGTNSITKDTVITVYTTIPRNLVITEIMYNPPENGADSLEFIEIYNNDTEAINLNGYYFSKGIDFAFPDIILDTSEYILVAYNSEAINNTFGVDAYQWTDGDLGNNGEDIEIRNEYEIIVDQVNYRDYEPWPTSADGQGPSLTLCDPDSDNSSAVNWSASIEFAAVNSVGDSIYASPGSACIPIPQADFTADETLILIGSSINFTDISTSEPTSWSWTFEGGTPETSTDENPVVTYNTEGVFDVSLTVTNVSGSDTETKADFISVSSVPPPPVANFTVDDNTVAVGENASFTDISTGEPTSWSWTFEGGTPETSTEQNPVITYNTKGVYDVTLIASNDDGDSTLVMNDYINVDYPPLADFVASVTEAELGTYIDFTDMSTLTPTSWAWTFEGASPETSTEQNPMNILYNSLGLFDVSLTVTNDFGTDTKTIADYISVIYDGINDDILKDFVIYPNPNNGKFFIKSDNNINKEISVYSVIGKLIYKSSLNNNITEFDLSQYKKGVYFVKVVDNKSGKYYTKKVLIK